MSKSCTQSFCSHSRGKPARGVAASVGAVLLTACGMIPYVPPPANDPNTAIINSYGPSLGGRYGIEVRILEPNSCAASKLASALAYSPNTTGSVETRVAAGEPLRMRLTWAQLLPGGAKSCSFSMQFTPVAGARYDSALTMSGNTCNVQIDRLRNLETDRLEREPVKLTPICETARRSLS